MPRSMNRLASAPLGVAMLLAALTLAACGGAAPPPIATGGTSGPDGGAGPGGTATTSTEPRLAPACELLTDADIQAITGMTVVSKDDSVADTVYANHCRWTIRRPDGGNGTLDLGLLSPEGRQRYDVTSEQEAFEPFQGLPADAAGGDPQSASIYAVRGDTLIDVYALSLRLSRETTGELARRVLEHLFGGSGPAATAGGGPATPGTGSGPSVTDPCSLLTDAEILEVTGVAAISHEGSPWFGQWDTSCTWQVASAGAVPATIKLLVKSPGGRASWDQYMVPIQGEFTAIPDLGDAAFAKVLWPTHVLVGDTYFSVQFADDSSSEQVSISTKLAEKVAAHVGA